MNDLQAKSTDTLALCPFCGGEAALIENEPTEGFHFVECADCAAHGSMTDREHAIAAWNRRAAMEFDNWFYLPKPKEPVVEVTEETTYEWGGAEVLPRR